MKQTVFENKIIKSILIVYLAIFLSGCNRSTLIMDFYEKIKDNPAELASASGVFTLVMLGIFAIFKGGN